MKIDIKKTKKILSKTPLFVARHAFFVCLVLFLLSLAIGFFVFYKYYILIQRVESESLEEIHFLDKDAYQNILNTWQGYERISQEADSKEYIDPFLETTSFPEN